MSTAPIIISRPPFSIISSNALYRKSLYDTFSPLGLIPPVLAKTDTSCVNSNASTVQPSQTAVGAFHALIGSSSVLASSVIPFQQDALKEPSQASSNIYAEDPLEESPRLPFSPYATSSEGDSSYDSAESSLDLDYVDASLDYRRQRLLSAQTFHRVSRFSRRSLFTIVEGLSSTEDNVIIVRPPTSGDKTDLIDKGDVISLSRSFVVFLNRWFGRKDVIK